MEAHHVQVKAAVATSTRLLIQRKRDTVALPAPTACVGGAGCGLRNQRVTKRRADAARVLDIEYQANVRHTLRRIDRLLAQNARLLRERGA